MEETLTERLRRMADRLTSERPSDRVLNFTLDDQKYWIKRKLGNGRNQLVKYSVEKEFYYEMPGEIILTSFRRSKSSRRITW